MKLIDVLHDSLNEQLLKDIGQKLKSVVQNVKDNISPNKEINLPGDKPSKGRDLEQLKSEWSKINGDKSNMNGYGEAVSPNENSVRTSAMMNAKKNILKKLGVNQASFGVSIVDQALFQLENGNYIQLIVLRPENIKLDEESQLNEKCWPGYTQKGMKEIFGKKYPNCVKKKKK